MNRRAERDDAGSVALEAAVLIPGLLTVGLLILAGGRVAVARQAVEGAAASAARAASLTRTASAAEQAAHDEALALLATGGPSCAHVEVRVSGDFAAPPGVPATVTVHLACTARTADLALPGLPGHKTVRATASAPLDTWRGHP